MKSRQAGSVLAISLVLLTAITLIALMGLQRSGMQTKIIANIQHKARVFNTSYSEVECSYDLFQDDTQELSDAKDKAGANHELFCSDPLPPAVVINNLRLVDNGNALGNPNTSMIIDEKSRGSRGAGKLKFELETVATLPNQMTSNQFSGLSYVLD